jgi:ABC-type Fe3+ transport system substrate-binding protein
MRKLASAATCLLALAAAGVLTLTAACSSSSPQSASTSSMTSISSAGGMATLVSKAKQEGTVLFYCTAAQNKMAAWTAAFTAKYGIKVQIYREPGGPLYQKFSEEEQVGKDEADVIQLSDLSTLNEAIKAGYMARYTPATAGDFPASDILPGKAYPMYTTTSAVGWNTKLVPKDLQAELDGPDPLKALLDPRLKGKIAVVDVAAGGPELANAANIVYNQASTYGWSYLKKLAKQDPVVVDSTTSVLQDVTSGQYWATTDGYDSVFAPQVVAGAPIAFRSLPTSALAEFYLSTVQQAPHPYAARLFEEWATSAQAQASLATITQGRVLIKGWTDNLAVTKEPWYTGPQTLWNGWATSPLLQGAALQTFYDKWHSIVGTQK